MDDPLTAHWAPLVNRANFTGREAEARPVIVLYEWCWIFGNRHNFNEYQQGVSSSKPVNPLVNDNDNN